MKRHVIAWIVLAMVAFGLPRQAFLTQWKAANAGDAWTPLSLSPLVWYKGNDNTTDSSGNGYTASWRGSSAYTNGVNGQAWVTGSSESAILAPIVDDMARDGGTVCFWVKLNVNGTGTRYFFDTTLYSRLIFYYYNDDTTLYVQTSARGEFLYDWFDYKWHHVVIVYGDNKVYIDGDLKLDGTDSGLGTASGDLSIGDRKSDANNGLDAAIDDFMVFNKVLTTDEMTKIYEWRE